MVLFPGIREKQSHRTRKASPILHDAHHRAKRREAIPNHGLPGGPTIINTVLLVITNIIDLRLSVTQAVDAPRFHHQWQPDVINYEPLLITTEAAAVLKAKGHTLVQRKIYPNEHEPSPRTWGDAESILIAPKTSLRQAANDPRNPDSGAVAW